MFDRKFLGLYLGLLVTFVFVVGISLGFPQRAYLAGVSTAMIVLAAISTWRFYRHPWYWVLLTAVSLLHIGLVAVIDWERHKFAAATVAPFAMADFVGIVFGLFYADKFLSKRARR